MEEFRGLFGTPPQEPSREGLGRVLDGFGDDFGRVLDGFGGRGEPKKRQKLMNFVDISPPPPRSPPGEGLGRVLDGFGEDFGRVLDGFGRILGGF